LYFIFITDAPHTWSPTKSNRRCRCTSNWSSIRNKSSQINNLSLHCSFLLCRRSLYSSSLTTKSEIKVHKQLVKH